MSDFRFVVAAFFLAWCAGFSSAAGQSAGSSPLPTPGQPRTWTTSDGRAFQATLLGTQGTQVTLRFANGQISPISLQRLSPGDQLFVKSATAPERGGGAATRVAAEKRTWPQTVEVDSRAIEVTLTEEKPAEQRYVYRSQTFEFVSQDKLAGSVMKEIARTFEATRSLVQALPWNVDPKPPQDLGYYQARFYVDREEYVAAGAPQNSGGVYSSRDRIFKVPFESLGLRMRGKTWFKDENYRNDTVVHEITHQLMHDLLPFLTTWVTEGTAEYTEMLPYNAGRFLAGSHERGLKEYVKNSATRTDPITIKDIGPVMEHLSMTNQAWHERAVSPREQHRLYYTSLLLVYFFSHLDGDGKGTRFLRYMDKMAEAREAWETFFKNPAVKVSAGGQYSYPHDLSPPPQSRDESYGIEQLGVLLDGRNAEQLQNDMIAGFKKIGIR